ncbi:MAG TPA: YfiR family protein [Clostridia bacterium]|nr:YfiR family protein [Clostridia bacterium]
MVLCAVTLLGQALSREYQLKALFLYRFTQFVDWPGSAFKTPASPIVIGVLGTDPFRGNLESAVRNERVHHRQLDIKRYSRILDATNCHLLFISSSENRSLEKILAELKGRSILTVGETEGFASKGGMIELFTEQNRIRFRINVKATREAKLQVSSKMLELGEVVDAQQE